MIFVPKIVPNHMYRWDCLNAWCHLAVTISLIDGNREINITKFVSVLPDSKVHGANMGPTWVRQDPGGPHVGLMNLAIWASTIYIPPHKTSSAQNMFIYTCFLQYYIKPLCAEMF